MPLETGHNSEPPIDRRQMTFGSAMLLAPAIISVLNGILIAVGRSGWAQGAAMLALVVGTLFLVGRCSVTSDRRLLLGLLILVAAQLGVLVFTLPTTEPRSPLRLLRVAVVLVSLATILSAVLAYTRALGAIKALLLAFGFASAVLVAEAISELLPGVTDGVTPRPEWSDRMVRQPDLGMSYRPHSVVDTYYPDNPRGYFAARDFRDKTWQLQVADSSSAEMAFPPDQPATVRVAIGRAPRAPAWHISLQQAHLPISALVAYTVDFRARADSPRVISVGFAQAHPPWRELGFYRNEKLTTEWKTFHEFFTAGVADSNGRIQFDLGGNAISVEIANAGLHVQLDPEPVEPPLGPDRFLVRYDFNAIGCRDSDYTALPTAGTVRILVLGDGAAMGTDVHQPDTFAKQLEGQDSATRPTISARPGEHLEVINCAVSGYGTYEEALFYRIAGAKYQPDIVLVMMDVNDDAYFRERSEREYFARAGRFTKLFSLWIRFEQHRLDRRLVDYSRCVAELRALDRDVRQHGARLMVAFFRTTSDRRWRQLDSTVTAELQGTDVRVIDLGRALADSHPDDELLSYGTGSHPNEIAHLIAAQELRRFVSGTPHIPGSR